MTGGRTRPQHFVDGWLAGWPGQVQLSGDHRHLLRLGLQMKEGEKKEKKKYQEPFSLP